MSIGVLGEKELAGRYDSCIKAQESYSRAGFVQKLEKPAVKSGDAEAMDQLRRLVRPFLLRRMKQDAYFENISIDSTSCKAPWWMA